MAFLSYKTILNKRIFPNGLEAGIYNFNLIDSHNNWVAGKYKFTTTQLIDNFGYILLDDKSEEEITNIKIKTYTSQNELIEECSIEVFNENENTTEISDFGLVWTCAGVATVNGKFGFVELNANDVQAVPAPLYPNERDILRYNNGKWENETFPKLAFIKEIFLKLPDENDKLNVVKTQYYQGEVFDPTGIEVYGIYTIDGVDQEPILISGWTYSTLAFPIIEQSREEKDFIISYTENNITVETSIKITITKKYVNKPQLINGNNFIYTGEEQTPIINGFIEGAMYINPNSILSATDAGIYTITYILDKNYAWTDETRDDYTITWIINKASQDLKIILEDGKLSTEADLILNNSENISNGITYSNNTENDISYEISISDEQYISADINNNSITIIYSKNAPNGFTPNPVEQHVYFKLIAAESKNYLYTERLLKVICKYTPTLEEASWQYIAYVSHMPIKNDDGTITYENKASEYWSIGELKQLVLNGSISTIMTFNSQVCNAYIFDFNEKGTIFKLAGKLEDDGEFKTLAFVDSNYNIELFDYTNKVGFMMNDSSVGNRNGWKYSYMRTSVLGSNTGDDGIEVKSDTLYKALPKEVIKYLKPLIVYTDNALHTGETREDNIYLESDITATTDYLPLLAASEVYPDIETENGNPLKNSKGFYVMNEHELKYCKKYDYFKSSDDRYAYNFESDKNNYTVQQWLRSPSIENPLQSYCVISNYSDAIGKIGSALSNYSLAISPIFLIAEDDIQEE